MMIRIRVVICCSGGLYAVHKEGCILFRGLHAVQVGYMDVQECCILFTVLGGYMLFRGAICGK